MALFDFTKYTYAGINSTYLFGGLNSLPATSRTATHFHMTSDSGGLHADADVYGSGFTYNSSHYVTDGLVTSVLISVTGYGSASYSGLAIDLSDAIAAYASSPNTIQAFLKVALADNDTFKGTNQSDYIAMFGGNDHIYGYGGEDSLNGGSGNDSLFGGSGKDILNGGSGDDSLVGAVGNDIYYVDSLGDTIVELSGSGTDSVRTSISLTLAANVENLSTVSADATSAINLTGNILNNTITGNAGDNMLKGDDGADVLIGGAGRDKLGGNGLSTTDDGDIDIYKFRSTTDSGVTSSTRDIIWGHFNGGLAGGDIIDLGAIDPGNGESHFNFIGSSAFTYNTRGEVRVVALGPDYLVQVNTDDDVAAEMAIVIHSNAHTFTAGDFVL